MSKTLIVFAGLPASGKTAIARRLHKELDAVMLDKDLVRDFMFQGHVDYSDQQNDLCVDLMYQVAEYLLIQENPPFVILDGRSYSRRKQIDSLKCLVTRLECRLCLVECTCTEETAKNRLAMDEGIHIAADRNFSMYVRSKASSEPINEPRLILDTDYCSPEQACEQVLDYLSGLK